MKLGVMASVSQAIDFETASLVALELGAVVEKEVIVTIEERLLDDSADKEELLVARAPVVVVMGHVDHGKTSLLDVIRQANVVSAKRAGLHSISALTGFISKTGTSHFWIRRPCGVYIHARTRRHGYRYRHTGCRGGRRNHAADH